jgi:hypothetical protein
MAKLGVGVGEEFPVDEAAPKEPAPESTGSDSGGSDSGGSGRCGGGHWHGRGPSHWHSHGRWHFAGHVLFRLAILALLIGGALSFFGRHFDGPHGFAPYPHHHFFFFPFFWIALIVALVFWRGHWRRRHWHWHDEAARGGDKEGT